MNPFFPSVQDSDQPVEMSEGSRDSSPNIHHHHHTHHHSATATTTPITTTNTISSSSSSKHTLPTPIPSHRLLSSVAPLTTTTSATENHGSESVEVVAEIQPSQRQTRHQSPANHSWHQQLAGNAGGSSTAQPATNAGNHSNSPVKPWHKHRRYSQSSQGLYPLPLPRLGFR